MPFSAAQPDTVAQNYAKSLYELADEAGGRSNVETTLAEIEEILELARENPRFAEFLSSQALGAKTRSPSLDAIFQGRVSPLVLRFIHVLNQKGRLPNLPAIATAFDAIVQEKFGRVEVDVFTAEPLSPTDLGQIRDRLSKALHKDVVTHPYVDASMIGGVKLRIGDQLVDGSVATKLRTLKDQIARDGGASLRAHFDRILGD